LFAEEIRKAREEEIVRREAKERTEGTAKKLTTLSEFGAWVQDKLFFLDYAPVIFTSATTGFHLDRLLEAVRYVAAQLQQKIPTAILNRTINDAVERRQPISAAGPSLKFYYATQVRQAPPTFLLFVNRDELFSDQYKKSLANELRAAFGYEGCPIVLVPKARPNAFSATPKSNPSTRSNGKIERAPPKSPTTPARSFSSRKMSKCRSPGPCSPPKSSCRNIFTANKTPPSAKLPCASLIHRIARTIADWGIADGYFSKADGEIFFEELTWLCVNQYGAFNSPVWFNVGLYHQYGVGKNSGKGNWFYNRETGEAERAPPSMNIRRAAPASSRA
jgi:hypothetical protein